MLEESSTRSFNPFVVEIRPSGAAGRSNNASASHSEANRCVHGGHANPSEISGILLALPIRG